MRGASEGSFVVEKRGRFRIDRSRKPGSFATNEIILSRLVRFLDAHYPAGGGGRILDAGAGTKPYHIVYGSRFAQRVSFDLPSSPHDISGVELVARSSRLPFPDASFDCILCTEVLEHVPDPQAVVDEFARALKPEGRLFLTTPFLLPLHEMPHDYYRYTPAALRLLAARSGLRLESLSSRGDFIGVLLSTMAFPVAKLFQLLSSRTRVNFSRPANPLLWLAVILPQALYLRYWRRAQAPGFCAKLYRRLEYATPGYISELAKSAPGATPPPHLND